MWRSGDQAAFVAAVRALRELGDSMVVVGGWSHRLHQFYPGVIPVESPLYTKDLDCAIARPPPKVSVGIDQSLKAANFAEHLKGSEEAFTEYYWNGSDSNLTVEFLVVQKGREGKTGLDVGGVVAQRLRYLEIGFVHPWRFTPTQALGFPVNDGEELSLQIVNPAAFVMNKLVTMTRRTKSEKKGKDLLYVHDTLLMFANAGDALQTLWARTFQGLSAATRKKVTASISAIGTLKVEAELAARAAVSVGRPVTAERILAACGHGLAPIAG